MLTTRSALVAVALGLLLCGPATAQKPEPKRLEVPLTRQICRHPAPSAHPDLLNMSQEFSFVQLADGIVIPLKNYYTIMYTGIVYVGTPQYGYRMVLDTGSTDMWLFSSTATRNKPSFIKFYDHSKSSTYKEIAPQKSFDVQYGKGVVKGFLSIDRAGFGDDAFTNNMYLGEVTDWTSNFENEQQPLDGITGLAFQALASDKYPGLVDALYTSGVISERVFSFVLGPLLHDLESKMILGPPDPKYYKNNIQWNPLIFKSAGTWTIAWASVYVGNAKLVSCQNSGGCAALVDTGTSLIGFPSQIFAEAVRKISSKRKDCLVDSKGDFACSSTSVSNLPSLSFHIGEETYTLEPSQYMISNKIGIMNIGDQGLIILGDTFIKNYYTVFDMDNSRIGFAASKNIYRFVVQIVGLSIAGIMILASFIVIMRAYGFCSRREGPVCVCACTPSDFFCFWRRSQPPRLGGGGHALGRGQPLGRAQEDEEKAPLRRSMHDGSESEARLV